MVCKIMFWFSLFLCYDSLISCHNLLAILSRGYVCCRFTSFIFIVCSSVDVRPLTPGLGLTCSLQVKVKLDVSTVKLQQRTAGFGIRYYHT